MSFLQGFLNGLTEQRTSDPYEVAQTFMENGDFVEAAKWFSTAADHGDMYAMNDLALLYLQGNGVAPDWSKAEALFRMSIAKGHTYAKLNFAQMIINHSSDTDYIEEALDLFHDLAENQKDPRAQRWLGRIYENGIGCEEDLDEAEYWYGLAEEQGFHR